MGLAALAFGGLVGAGGAQAAGIEWGAPVLHMTGIEWGAPPQNAGIEWGAPAAHAVPVSGASTQAR
jgi:hypothetical protein